MTREEAISMLHGIRADNLNLDDTYTKDKYEALGMAIKALEQEPILDKIRAEIETKYGQCDICEYFEDYDYEHRLKADMVAMLTDMLIDVEEIASREQWCDYANDNCISRYDVEDLFQQKINSLKEGKDD